MTPNIKRSILFTLGLMVASVLLTPFGLGWVPFVVGIGLLVYSLARLARSTSSQSEAGAASRGLFARKQGSGAERHREAQERAEQERRERAQAEADCGLTHEERVRFQDIVRDIGADGGRDGA